MTEAQKDTLFQATFWGAGLFYVWALFVFWMAPEWELSEKTYYFMGVLPALMGVVLLSISIGLYVDLRKEE